MSYCVDVSSWRAANISDDRIIWWPGTDGHPARTVWYCEDSRSATLARALGRPKTILPAAVHRYTEGVLGRSVEDALDFAAVDVEFPGYSALAVA
jgi:hypothetical protein